FVDDAFGLSRQSPQNFEMRFPCATGGMQVPSAGGRGNLRGHGLEIAQLAGAENARMRGGDLLNQAGARTRHAQNKNRQLRRNTPFGGRFESLWSESCDQLVDRDLQLSIIEMLTSSRSDFFK